MPGILPMKVIKVGSNAQSRIAQACDRCRSKKIRCDGIRPCCTQCSNVGFECKTSDKLSRRAFPRGYTESLEERVRSLEAEVRELKDLLDEKDEKIDILSKMHSNSNTSTNSSPRRESMDDHREDVFRVQASPLLFDSEDSDSYFMGASSGRAFVDAFKRKVQETGKSCAGFNTDGFLNLHAESTKNPVTPIPDTTLIPPRIFTDQMVNIFFQEWAPLFPVLHKPTFLQLYAQFVEKPEQVTSQQKIAQLYLVFGIAAISSDAVDCEQLSSCEASWRTALDALVMDNTLVTLQCLILAQLFCIAKGDYKCLQHYKAIAVGMSHRLGLHQSQKRFSFGALTIETRKRVFWSLYTVDCFSAASLGLPKLLTEADVYAEYPNDIDDEYVTEKGFQPTLPGEFTKISSALALFRLSRILSKVLDKNYPAAATHDLSLSLIGALEQELKDWSTNLPSRLKLTFAQDKPSTDVTGNRSPLLSLTFYYIRTLIHRPVIGSCPSTKSSSSVIALADSSKAIIQIAQLLQERHLAFSLCLNKAEVLTLCGLSLLYQRLDLKQNGKLMRDGEELVQEVIKSLTNSKASGASDFTKLAISMGIEDPRSVVVPVLPQPTLPPSPTAAKSHRTNLDASNNLGILASDVTHSSPQQRLPTISTTSISQVDNISPSSLSNYNANSFSDMNPDPETQIRDQKYHHRSSPRPSLPAMPHTQVKTKPRTKRSTNLDYLSLTASPTRSRTTSPTQTRTTFSHHGLKTPPPYKDPHPPNRRPSSTCWENIFGSGSGASIDESQIYDAMYGGTSLPLSLSTVFTNSSPNSSTEDSEWSPRWDGGSSFRYLGNCDGVSGKFGEGEGRRSGESFSEDSFSSGEEGFVEGSGGVREGERMDYEGMLLMDEELRGW